MELDLARALRVPGEPQAFDLVQFWQPLEFGGETIALSEPVRFRGAATFTGEGDLVLVKGDFHAQVERPCSRCLAPVRQDVDLQLEEAYSRQADPDGERFVYAGETLILDEMLQQNLLLRLPMRALCAEACKGLCPRCGRPLNQGDCDCQATQVPHPELLKWLQDNEEV